MKNTIKVFGIIAIVAIIGFFFAACEEDNSNPFIGNWSGTTDFGVVRLTVTTSTWTYDEGSYSHYSGTYTYSGNIATFIFNGNTAGTAIVSGNTMTGSVNSVGFTVSRNN